MINLFNATLGKEELDEISSSFDNSWMGFGPKVVEFENRLSKKIGINDMVMMDSGSSALTLAVHLLNLPAGSKIVLPSFTWVSCVHAIILNGHIPVFADIDYNTQNVTKKTISKVVKDAKAIMVVHYAGLPVDIDELDFGIPIIEDAAHAIVSKYKGKPCGTLGKIGIYSFDSVKNLATPDAGGIVSDPETLDIARKYRYLGIEKTGYFNTNSKKWWEYNINYIWHKMVPNDISASIGLCQIKKLDKNQKRRKEIWDVYQKNIKVEKPLDYEHHSYFTYLIKTKNRDKLAKIMLDNDIFVTLKFHPLHLNKIFQSNVNLPVTELINETGLNLPIHPNVTDSDLDKIIDLVNKYG